MHIEFLIEDQSGKLLLESIQDRLLTNNATSKIHSYKGVGRLRKKMTSKTDASKRILLDNLPRLLKGYGKSLQHISAAVVVIIDLDNRDGAAFERELKELLHHCNPSPTTLFVLAIEEMEAWLLGDPRAIKRAYPNAKMKALSSYTQDSICGTWEVLADALYPGGAKALKKEPWPASGKEKCRWAQEISPHPNLESNRSKSFQFFRDQVRLLCKE